MEAKHFIPEVHKRIGCETKVAVDPPNSNISDPTNLGDICIIYLYVANLSVSSSM